MRHALRRRPVFDVLCDVHQQRAIILARLGRSRSWRCRTIGHPGIALHLLNLPLPFLGLLEQKVPKDLPAMLAKFKKSNVKIDRTLTRVTASERRLVVLATLTLFSERHRLYGGDYASIDPGGSL
jgi:hypothetical protein